MPTAQITSTLTIGGVTKSATISRTADAMVQHEITLTAGDAGTLTTRTDNDTGVITLGAHTITDADTVDVYWDGGVRYGMTVTAYDGTTITVDSGAGDNLPTEDDAVVVGVRQTVNSDFDGDNAQLVALVSTYRAHAAFIDSGSATLKAVELPTSDEPWYWAADNGHTNPLTGNAVDTIEVSSGSTSGGTLYIWALYDSTE